MNRHTRARAAFDRDELAWEIRNLRRDQSGTTVAASIARRFNVEVSTIHGCVFLRIEGILATSAESLENAIDNWWIAAERRSGASRGGTYTAVRRHRALPRQVRA